MSYEEKIIIKSSCGKCKDCLKNWDILDKNILENLPKEVEIRFVDGVTRKGTIKYNKDGEIVLDDGSEADLMCNIMEFVINIEEVKNK